jgi:hypothetical protein
VAFQTRKSPPAIRITACKQALEATGGGLNRRITLGMRRVILVLVATAMVFGGGYALILQLTTPTVMYRFIVSGVFVLALGIYLLREEFFR